MGTILDTSGNQPVQPVTLYMYLYLDPGTTYRLATLITHFDLHQG